MAYANTKAGEATGCPKTDTATVSGLGGKARDDALRLAGPYSYLNAPAGFALATANDCQDTVSQAIATAAAAASTKVHAGRST